MPTKSEAMKAERARQQREYRAKTGYEYDRKYKRAVERAQRRLAKQFPKAYLRILNEEREKEGLGPQGSSMKGVPND